MLEAIILGGIVVVLVVGFYLTRGAGGMPGGVDDPARQQLLEYTPLGDHVPLAGDALDVNPEHELD